jgi:hypothetical protein
MSIDAQVLAIAFLAISLKLLLRTRGTEGVEVEDELLRKHPFQLDDRRVLFARARIQSDLRALSVPLDISKGISDSHVQENRGSLYRISRSQTCAKL